MPSSGNTVDQYLDRQYQKKQRAVKIEVKLDCRMAGKRRQVQQAYQQQQTQLNVTYSSPHPHCSSLDTRPLIRGPQPESQRPVEKR